MSKLSEIGDRYGIAQITGRESGSDLEETAVDECAHRLFDFDQLFLYGVRLYNPADLDEEDEDDGEDPDAEYDTGGNKVDNVEPAEFRVGVVEALSPDQVADLQRELQAYVIEVDVL